VMPISFERTRDYLHCGKSLFIIAIWLLTNILKSLSWKMFWLSVYSNIIVTREYHWLHSYNVHIRIYS
jgi:hypothetical protein